MYFGPSSDTNGNAGRGYGGGAVTLDYVDMFTSATGEKTSYEEWIEKNGSIGTIDNNPFTDRDPRLYETVMIVGIIFKVVRRKCGLAVWKEVRKQTGDVRLRDFVYVSSCGITINPLSMTALPIMLI